MGIVDKQWEERELVLIWRPGTWRVKRVNKERVIKVVNLYRIKKGEGISSLCKNSNPSLRWRGLKGDYGETSIFTRQKDPWGYRSMSIDRYDEYREEWQMTWKIEKYIQRRLRSHSRDSNQLLRKFKGII